MKNQPTLTAEYCGSFAILFDGETFDYSPNQGRGGVLPRFCRELIRRGHSPNGTIEATRSGTQVYANHETLSFWAGISIEEISSRSIRRVKYRPMPVSVSAVLPKKAHAAITQPKVA